MNIELIRQWIDDLRYGGHEQAQGALHIDEGYCCLGRAIEVIHGPDKWQIVDVSSKTDDHSMSMQERFKNLVAPHVYKFPYDDPTMIAHDACWRFLSDDDAKTMGFYELLLTVHELSAMNDDGWSFAEIADYVEESLETYLRKQNEINCAVLMSLA